MMAIQAKVERLRMELGILTLAHVHVSTSLLTLLWRYIIMTDKLLNEINKLLPLVRRRQQLLDEHPELLEFQKKIDDTLEEVGTDPHERCVVIQHLMAQSAFNLVGKMKEVREDIDELERCMEELKETYKAKSLS